MCAVFVRACAVGCPPWGFAPVAMPVAVLPVGSWVPVARNVCAVRERVERPPGAAPFGDNGHRDHKVFRRVVEDDFLLVVWRKRELAGGKALLRERLVGRAKLVHVAAAVGSSDLPPSRLCGATGPHGLVQVCPLLQDLGAQVALLRKLGGIVCPGIENFVRVPARHAARVCSRRLAWCTPRVKFPNVLDGARWGVHVDSSVFWVQRTFHRSWVETGGTFRRAVVEVGNSGAVAVRRCASNRCALGEPKARLAIVANVSPVAAFASIPCNT